MDSIQQSGWELGKCLKHGEGSGKQGLENKEESLGNVGRDGHKCDEV